MGDQTWTFHRNIEYETVNGLRLTSNIIINYKIIKITVKKDIRNTKNTFNIEPDQLVKVELGLLNDSRINRIHDLVLKDKVTIIRNDLEEYVIIEETIG